MTQKVDFYGKGTQNLVPCYSKSPNGKNMLKSSFKVQESDYIYI